MRSHGNIDVVDSLSKSWLEEADERLILHVGWAVEEKKCERGVVISNDTDTFALLLYYLPYLKQKGLKELWQKFGTGEKRRLIPLHDILEKMGESFCKVVLKAHVLTGDDSMSKIGTKKSALVNGNPVEYLLNFAMNKKRYQDEISVAEKYLTRVWMEWNTQNHVK